MKTLLRIDSSLRLQDSYTRQLADHFQAQWLKQNPDGKVVRRDLSMNPVPHLTQTTLNSFNQETAFPGQTGHSSQRLVDELKTSDDVLISAPLYNLSLPSNLKAWIDHVVVSGKTFTYADGVYSGLLFGKRAFLILAQGGYSDAPPADFRSEYLPEILKFMGITDCVTFQLRGTSAEESLVKRQLAMVMEEIDWHFSTHRLATWKGDFTLQDKVSLSRLRESQAKAIVSGDAIAYAELCAEDITLLIPGHPVITGKSDFLAFESAVFKNADFSSFTKQPVSIERCGSIVYEVGYQEISMKDSSNHGGIFASRQKYLHLYRSCAEGWRYVSLMSNPAE